MSDTVQHPPAERRSVVAGQLSMLAILAGLLLFTGCVNERDSGTSKIFTIQLWMPLLMFIVGIIVIPIGFLLKKRSEVFSWILMIAGAIMTLVFAPTLLLDKTVVSPEEMTVRSGVWGLMGNHRVKYDNLESVRLTTETSRGGTLPSVQWTSGASRGRRNRKPTNHYLFCECKDGTYCKILLNWCTLKAAPHFLKHVQAKGIPIMDEFGNLEQPSQLPM